MAREIDDRETRVTFLATIVKTNAAAASEGFRRRYEKLLPRAERAAIPDLGAVLALVARDAAAKLDALRAASDVHDDELADDDAPRRARDESAAALYDKLVGQRGTVEHVFGVAGLKALGLDGPTPRDTKALGSHARRFLGKLAAPDRPPLTPVRRGVTVDFDAWVEEIRPLAEALDAAEKQVLTELREAQTTQSAKDRAKVAFDVAYRDAANLVAAALAAAGLDAQAEQVRPTLRRASGEDEEPTPPTPPTPST